MSREIIKHLSGITQCILVKKKKLFHKNLLCTLSGIHYKPVFRPPFQKQTVVYYVYITSEMWNDSTGHSLFNQL